MQTIRPLMLLPLLLAYAYGAETKSTLVYSWVQVEYDWPNDTMRQEYIASQKFIIANNVITGIKLYKDQVYLTVSRFRRGVPSTLNRVVMKDNRSVLQPFPSWANQTEGDCNALQCVQSMEIDPNTGLMWILDNGRMDFLDDGEPRNLCPARLVIYDLENARTVHTYTFPSDVADPTSCFLNDIVLHYVDGKVKYAYISDTSDAKLYVYNYEDDTSHFYQDPSMLPDTEGGFAINGIALSADFKYVYYSPLDGLGLFQVPTSILNDPEADLHTHVRRVGTRRSRSDGLAYGQRNLYFGLLDLSGANQWQVSVDAEDVGYGNVTMTTQVDLVRDDVNMVWVDSFAWDESGNLWFTANDLTKYLGRTMDFTGASGTNMHVWKVFVDESSYLSSAAALGRPSCQYLPWLVVVVVLGLSPSVFAW